MAANSKGVRPTTLKHTCSSKTNQVYITPCTHAQSKAWQSWCLNISNFQLQETTTFLVVFKLKVEESHGLESTSFCHQNKGLYAAFKNLLNIMFLLLVIITSPLFNKIRYLPF